ncbi:FtsK/SpoIIIE domain-containing protein [Crossiella sp. SN42]|uniref:FtsK/SpoIIIE domain-containing protein n=1 Tax=Crossiella sp. SN42 TaxID=2944808 RepID=UPI00207C903A|nr:FtsK/SpoIIIE domain-containing protein [Crossiella sp. SN42]MCO1579155.1 FtsK/SpoIIIE domain-containing protein [Crossiella sp. SN42]
MNATGDPHHTDEDTGPAVPVMVDQPHTTNPNSGVPQREERRPIIPAWLRSWTALRAALVFLARHGAYAAGFHLLRLPKYVAVALLWRAPAGAWITLTALGRWMIDADTRPNRTTPPATTAAHKGTGTTATAARKDTPTPGAIPERSETYFFFTQLRNHRISKRVRMVLVGAVVTALSCVAVWVFAPLWMIGVVVAGLVVILAKVGTPVDKPIISRAVVVPAARPLHSQDVLNALEAIGIRNAKAAHFPAPISRDGAGWRAVVDLPPGVVAAEVIERRPKLASALSRPLGCIWPEAAPDVHPGRVVIWVADVNLTAAAQPAWPLAAKGTVDLFEGIPVGTDPRGRWVSAVLMFASVVIGAIPRMGKTVWLRALLLAAALDVRAELHVFDLKGNGDLRALEDVAHRYRCGYTEQDIAYALADMRELSAELLRRSQVIRDLPRDVCPEAKITPHLAGVRDLGLHPVVIGIDECHKWFTHPEHGAELAALVEDLVRRGPAAGIITILATQRPDQESLPPRISSNAAIRICLKVMDWRANDMVLGTGANASGVSAVPFSILDKGIAIATGIGDEPVILRGVPTDTPHGPNSATIARRARALREAANRLSGYAIDTTAGTDPDTITAASTLLADINAVFPVDATVMWNESIVDRLAQLRPDIYGAWAKLERGAKATQLTTALRPYGIRPVQHWGTDPDTGEKANRRAITRTDVHTALAAAKIPHPRTPNER